jgi:hypothetical protein
VSSTLVAEIRRRFPFHAQAADAKRAAGWLAARVHPAAAKGLEPGDQFIELEWLGQVIVAAVQADHAVPHGAARGEDEDGVCMPPAGLRQDFEAVQAGQGQVKHDHVGAAARQAATARAPSPRLSTRMPRRPARARACCAWWRRFDQQDFIGATGRGSSLKTGL